MGTSRDVTAGSLVASVNLDHGLLRGLRAAVLAVPTVAIALLAHLSVDGCASPVGVVTAIGITWPAAVLLLARQRRLPSLLTWLVGSQLVLHMLLATLCDEVVSGQVTAWNAAASLPADRMLLAHGLALVATAILLGRADAGLWATQALVRALRLLKVPDPLMFRGTPILRRPDAVASGSPGLVVHDVWCSAAPVRRGPPALLAP